MSPCASSCLRAIQAINGPAIGEVQASLPATRLRDNARPMSGGAVTRSSGPHSACCRREVALRKCSFSNRVFHGFLELLFSSAPNGDWNPRVLLRRDVLLGDESTLIQHS